jgi:hypothetical protein
VRSCQGRDPHDFGEAAAFAGVSYPKMLEMIIDSAIDRLG